MMARPLPFFLLAAGLLGALAAACATSSDAAPDAGTSGTPGFRTGTSGTGTGSGRGPGIMIGLGGDSSAGSGSDAGSSSSGSGSSGPGSSSGTSTPDATTSDATGTSSSGSGSGTGSASGSGSGSGSGSASGTGSGSDAGSGSCYKPPSKVFKETTAGVYCPFSGTGGADNVTCAAGQHCCEPPTSADAVSTCEPSTTSCTLQGSTDWGCEGAPDCASHTGTVCCGTGTIETQPAQPQCGDGGTPAFPYVSAFTGTSCQATCSTYQVCSQDSECPGGAAGSCVAIEPKGNPIGYCKQ